MNIAGRVMEKVRPVILSGGLGTRLRPRTEHIPKPLIPVDGRPLLWYVFDSLSGYTVSQPIVVLGYKAELIQAYFETSNVEFRYLPGRTMAQAFLEVTETDTAPAFLCMSSDVIFGKQPVATTLEAHEQSKEDVALFVNLNIAGHKNWEFIVHNEHLIDVRRKPTKTNNERLLLLVKKESLQRVRESLPNPITDENVPDKLKGFQTGWTLILKIMTELGIPIYSKFVDAPMQNVNAPGDLALAEILVKEHLK